MPSPYTPVSELHQYESDRITWQLALPDYAPADAIGINMGRLAKLAYLGGIGELTISGYSGDQSSEKISANGLNMDGSVTGTASSKLQIAPIQKTSLSGMSPNSVRSDICWPNATIAINMAEITDSLSARKNGALRDPKAWSQLIGKALKQGVRQSGRQSLVSEVPVFNKIKPLFITSFSEVIHLANFPGESIGSNVVGVLGTMACIGLAMDPLAHKIAAGTPYKDNKFSAVPGVHVDRYMLLAAATDMTRVTKAI